MASDIDPLSQETLFYRAYFHYRSAEYKTALKLYDQCLANNPNNIPAYIVRSYCLLKTGKYDEAILFLENMPEEIVVPGERLGIFCLANILKKDTTAIQKYFSQLKSEAQKPTSFQAHSYLYLSYALMNKADEAFAWMEQALQLKSPVLLLSYTDPLAGNLTSDVRYNKYKNILYRENENSTELQNHKPSLLDDQTANVYVENLLRYLDEEEPFLIPNLSLRNLAEQVEIHPNKLSWLLNEKLGKNFNEFINFYRIEYFKKLAQNPENSHISLIGLAYESGFNSKTVFNTYFKKETGMTPKEYLKSQV